MVDTVSTDELSKEFAAVVASVFDSMVGMPASQSEVLEGAPQHVPGNILAMITVSAPDRKWIVTLHCDVPLAHSIYGAMFGELPENAPIADVYDAIGELANVIVGNFKTALTVGKEPLKMSVPSVEMRRHIPAPSPEEVSWFAIKFDIEKRPLFGSLTIQNN